MLDFPSPIIVPLFIPILTLGSLFQFLDAESTASRNLEFEPMKD